MGGGREGGRANHQSESGEETEDGAKKREREGGFRKEEEEVDCARSGRQKDKWTLRTCTQSMCKCARGGILGRRISSCKYAGAPKRPESLGVEKGGGYCGGGSKVFNMEDRSHVMCM